MFLTHVETVFPAFECFGNSASRRSSKQHSHVGNKQFLHLLEKYNYSKNARPQLFDSETT